MDLRTILDRFARGALSIEEMEKEISLHAIEHVEDIAKIDVGREARKGLPEIIYAERKQYSDTVKIATSAVKKNGNAVISRIKKRELSKLTKNLENKGFKVYSGKNCTTIVVSSKAVARDSGKIGIVAAGTSDIGVAEEARLVAEAMGCTVFTSYDIGVAGIHRLFPVLKKMVEEDVDVIIVVAGMEGALASVVTSMVSVPVIGVPTSVGYGFGSGGVTALASMLQSCTLGLAVVNIDNGVGAGAFAASIAKKSRRTAQRL